jgi:hypothetical protein
VNRCLAIWYPSLLAAIAATIGFLMLPSWIACGPFVAALLLVMDAKARLSDYRRLSISINRWGFLPEIYEPYLRTKCSREVLRAAAPHVPVSMIYQRHGYRWWHLAPDGAFTRNSPFLRPRFWRAALGV